MLELLILKRLLYINNYNQYRQHIKINKDNKELYNIYNTLDSLIEVYNRDITFDEFKLSLLVKYPDYECFTTQIEKAEVSDELLSSLINTTVERSLAHNLALISLDVSEGRKEVEAIHSFYETSFKERQHIEDVVFITDNLEELYNDTRHNKGLRWRLNTLNRMLGSLRKGDFGFIFARPETGKTTFLASETTFFASQTSQPIIWFNNEEGGAKVKIRCFQAALGCTLTTLYTDREKAEAEYLRRTHGNILLYDDAGIHRKRVESIIKQYQPALVVFDQIDKVKGFINEREDLRLGSIYIWARELAKSYCPVIGVCQADVTGEGRKWLNMDNVANAKTAKQAEADWILGIGATHEIGLEHIRYLHLSKNKLSGDEDSDPTMRHGRIECIIQPELARYKDL
jgi:replicative DNA helicase